MKKLKYPVGSKIMWCGEKFEVLENYGDADYVGKVRQGDDIIDNFYFCFQGDEAVFISK